MDRIRRWAVVGPAAASLLFVGTGCSGDEGAIGVTEADFSVTPDESSAPAGDVTFDVQNDAEQTHEFVVIKSDLAEDSLPLNDEGVDEEGEGVEVIDEIEDVEAGGSQSLTVDLEAGSYVLVCNLPGHYAQGMYAAFTVE